MRTLLTFILFLAAGWLLPWWHVAPLALTIGLVMGQHEKQLALKVALAAGGAWLILVLVLDHRSMGIVGHRLQGLFSLPSIHFVYVIMGLLGSVTAFLWVSSGLFLRRLLR